MRNRNYSFREALVIVKKQVVIWIIVVFAVVIGGLVVVVFVPGRERVSLTLLHYPRWSHGATLKLSNDTRKTITYFTHAHGGPILFLRKTENGWTNTSLLLKKARLGDPNGAKPSQFYSLEFPSSPKKVGDVVELALGRELKPGQSAEVYVDLEPDGLPVRAGVVCSTPQGPVAQCFVEWIARVKRWCGLRPKPPGQFEVWCSEPLQVSAKPTRMEGK